MSTQLKFYFDVISPFAYLGWCDIYDVAARNDAIVEPVPILFAALLNHHGHKGPAEIPEKRKYIFKEVLRRAHDTGVPLIPPPAHPFNPLLALRIASVPMEPETRRKVIDALFREIWAHGHGATDPRAVGDLLDSLGLPGDGLLASATSPAGKQRVRDQTDAAIALGLFGVPTVISGGELFWGQDSFPHLERYLRGEDVVDPEAVSRWAELPIGASR